MNSEYVDKTLEILLSIESLYYHDQWSVKSYNISLSNIKQQRVDIRVYCISTTPQKRVFEYIITVDTIDTLDTVDCRQWSVRYLPVGAEEPGRGHKVITSAKWLLYNHANCELCELHKLRSLQSATRCSGQQRCQGLIVSPSHEERPGQGTRGVCTHLKWPSVFNAMAMEKSLIGKVIETGGVKIDRDTATVDRTSSYSQLRRLGVFRLMDR